MSPDRGEEPVPSQDGDGGFPPGARGGQAVEIAEYDPALHFYRAVATWPTIDAITALDFVLFVELIRPMTGGHDQSTPLVDADLIRPEARSFPPRFSGASTTVGIMDTGFMVGDGAAVMHSDLSKFGCGINFTTRRRRRLERRVRSRHPPCWARSPARAPPTSATEAWPPVWEAR